MEEHPSSSSAAYYRLKAEDPERLAAMERERDEARGAMQAMATPEADTAAPEGVSQTIWNKANAGDFGGFNVTSVTRNPAVRDALVEAGFGDWVKSVYEQHMDQNAAHAIGNGADAAGAWERANQSVATADDWYAQNYGVYGNNTVAGDSNSGSLGFGHVGANPVGTDDNPYVAPGVTTGGGQAGGGSQ